MDQIDTEQCKGVASQSFGGKANYVYLFSAAVGGVLQD